MNWEVALITITAVTAWILTLTLVAASPGTHAPGHVRHKRDRSNVSDRVREARRAAAYADAFSKWVM